ncbi:MAG: hypothetical protein HZA21_03220 [Nitrospirae bacterium]|nr:hypothetical protein [Nitrospirota bacterium]
MERVTRCITKTLTLKSNDKESAPARPGERKCLGLSFTFNRQPKRRIAPKAVERFKKRVRE